MNDVADLYQELIIDHSSRPRNFRSIPGARQGEGFNPLCGDKVTVYLKLEGDVVADASFQGEGCAISKASASLMTEAVKGRKQADVERLFAAFQALVTGADGAAGSDVAQLGKLTAFSGLHEFPMRVKCGVLAWHTLIAALKREPAVSTELRE
jgi:nitrogen fixation NifU-like protein